MKGKLPGHVPVFIDKEDIMKLRNYLASNGYEWVFLQIVKPRQIIGMVKPIIRKEKNIEHHIRVFTNGKITSEFELPRVKEMWLHLTSLSYSAHEKVIDFLNEINIEYKVDEKLRERYNREAEDDYPRDHMDFLRWLFGGVIFWSPLGYLWRFGYNIKNKIKSINGKYEDISKDISRN